MHPFGTEPSLNRVRDMASTDIDVRRYRDGWGVCHAGNEVVVIALIALQ
jgi:hypothetical protein